MPSAGQPQPNQPSAVLEGGHIVLDGSTREVFSQVEKLKECQLVPPPITILSQKLGKTMLSVAEFKECLKRTN